MNYSLFTSESVCCGHPDKICDRISDAILDEALKRYSKSRVAVETLVTKDNITVAGEVTTAGKIPYKNIIKRVVEDIGYNKNIYNFSTESNIRLLIHEQSQDISLGVDGGGAGDQGMMFGYATSETEELMPLPIVVAHELVRGMDKLQNNDLTYLRPDGKSQVTVTYESHKPVKIEKIVLAKPHSYIMDDKDLKKILTERIVNPLLSRYGFGEIKLSDVVFNGTGKWEIGGPATDTGVTGRKIVVDSYGGMSKIGGGCFSGKDPTKVDRSGAYAARFIARKIVEAKLADRCEVQLAYVIGQAYPVAKDIETFGTEKAKIKSIKDFAWKQLDLSVNGIIENLNLRQPIYEKTSSYGHFGCKDYPWER